MREVKRELHTYSKQYGDEIYQEFNSSCDVERLWHSRLSKNDSILTACLVYKYKDNGKVIQVINLK
jgi:hypothetical protein